MTCSSGNVDERHSEKAPVNCNSAADSSQYDGREEPNGLRESRLLAAGPIAKNMRTGDYLRVGADRENIVHFK